VCRKEKEYHISKLTPQRLCSGCYGQIDTSRPSRAPVYRGLHHCLEAMYHHSERDHSSFNIPIHGILPMDGP
jgi:hypothetical protein